MDLIEKEYIWFKDHLNELVKDYNDQYIIIQDNQVIDSFYSFSYAYNNAVIDRKLIPGTFIIQFCSLDESKICAHIFTPNIFI